MKWIRDNTGRFSQRPFYEAQELDFECETLVTTFLQSKYGKVSFPLTTEDLTILIEQNTSDLDLYADLKKEGDEVEGMTLFLRKNKPRVLIDQRLSDQPNRENRLRTTLSHELGHVKLHRFLVSDQQLSLFNTDDATLTIVCKRDTILNAREIDWMEWQAGYASGAYLMPAIPVRELVQHEFSLANAPSVQSTSSKVGLTLIHEVQTLFQVSEDAARIRLIKLGYLTNSQTPMSLL
jgi:Zn-dependent peptidase ImmA (M78 family)